MITELTKDDKMKIMIRLRRKFGKNKITHLEANIAISKAEEELLAEKNKKANENTVSKQREEEKRTQKTKNEKKARKLNRKK